MANYLQLAISVLLAMFAVTTSLPVTSIATTQDSEEVTSSIPDVSNPPLTEQDAIGYLRKYRYLDSDDSPLGSLMDPIAIQRAVLQFQRMAGLEQTGVLDSETLETMSLPRCGVSDSDDEDQDGGSQGQRKRRFAVHNSQWPKTDLTYKIIKYTPDLTEAEVQRDIRRAFDVWQEVTPLRFAEVDPDDEADIVILFQAREHGDGYPFDGRSGTLAHAFYPRWGGDAHFDDDEVWTIDTFRGTNLFQVAAHEFGHSLGLRHSTIRTALMAPFYRGYDPDFSLHQDDIEGIQSLYGGPVTTNEIPSEESTATSTTITTKAQAITTEASEVTTEEVSSTTTKTTTTTTTQFVPSDPDLADLCSEGIFDVVTEHQLSNGEVKTYAFRKDYYIELTNGEIGENSPQKISKGWPGLPNDLDAALYWGPTYKTFRVWKGTEWGKVTKQVSPSRTYFFKGNLYWRFQNRVLDQGYPQEISKTWNLPNDLDAAVLSKEDGKSLVFKGDNYYVYNRKQNRIEQGFPKAISSLDQELNSGIDSGFRLDKDIYFTKGAQLYKYDGQKIAVGYPKDTRTDLLACHKLRSINAQFMDGMHSGVSKVCGTIVVTLLSILVALIFS